MTSIVFVVVTFPLVVAIASPSIVLVGTNEHLMPGILSDDDVREEVGLEEFLPENVGKFGDDEEKAQHVGEPEVVVGYRGVSCGLQSSLVNIAPSRYTWSRKVKVRTKEIQFCRDLPCR